MKKTRQKFSDKFKSQVALEAVKERESLAEISNVLSPGVKYEYQVKARCTSVESAYSSLDYFTMPYPPSTKFACGTDDEVIEISNTTPKASLQVGDIIYSGQFPIKLTEVSGANGLFKGKGRMRVPMFANAQVNMQFNDIKVNELNQVYGGELVSVYNEHSEFLVENGTDYVAEDDIAEDDIAEDQVISPNVVVDDDINSVYVNDAGEVIVVNTDGEEEVVDTDDLPEGEEVVIEDERGEQWVVDEGGRVSNRGGNNGNTSDGSIEIDRTNVVNYTLPLTIYLDDDYYLIDPDKKEFSSGDTITIQSYMAGIGFFVKDAQNKSIELLPSYFPDNSGYLWTPGFIVDIEDLEQDYVKSFEILIEGLDTLQLAVVKEEITEDLKGAELEAFKDDARDGIDDGESWNPNGYACNNAVRAFLYYHKTDAVLFPVTHPDYPNSSYGSGLEGPDGLTILKGDISWDGTADKMWDDFDGDGNDLTGSFTEIAKNSTETWNAYFDRLQKEANKGTVIVGVVHSDNRAASRGHVVALMPESLCSGDQTKANDVGADEEDDVGRPCALEAGGNEKEITWFKQNSSELDNYKWFKYDD